MINLIIGSLFLILGLFAGIVSLLGLLKFKFIMNRMHAAAIVDALSLSLIIIGLIFVVWDFNFIFKLILILVFQWIGSPIAAHMVMRLEYETDKEVSDYVRKEGK